ncbi:MAG: methyltransferase domain-containing protein [Stagnimonas sp.]|nr:methyltransferase domain-containing protein [Stagnimonas sp.]
MSASIKNAFGTAMTDDEYGENWVASSVALDRDNDYAWMASQLGSAHLVLDVGAGAGRGLYQLARNGARVICVEINARLLKEAATYLTLMHIPVSVCDVVEVVSHHQGPPGTVLLVKGDLMDPALDELPAGAFKAVTCWLIGANPTQITKTIGVPIAEHSGATGPVYRQAVQGRCRDLGLKLLCPNGALHFVDRAFMSSWNHKTQLREHEQKVRGAEVGEAFSIGVEEVMFRRSGLGMWASGVQLVPNQRLPSEGITALQSVIARRR